MSPDDVRIEALETAFQGYFRVDRYRLRHRLHEGGWSQPVTREVFERGHAVAVVLYDPDRDELVLIEQFRIGAFAASRSPFYPDDASPWLYEIVAGIIDDPGESAEAVARREAMEEAGVTVTELEPVTRYLVSPGGGTESVTIFCGRVDATGAGGIHGLDHEHEDIRVFALSADECFRWLDKGRFINAMTLIGLQWFRHHHARLREAWKTP